MPMMTSTDPVQQVPVLPDRAAFVAVPLSPSSGSRPIGDLCAMTFQPGPFCVFPPETEATCRRSLDRSTAARISPLPPPEEVFVDWLLSVPHGADLEDAARRQIEIIDRLAPIHPDVRSLRVLLGCVAGGSFWRRPPGNL